MENLEASGGWISSASDLVQFLDALNGSLSDSSNGYQLLSVSASQSSRKNSEIFMFSFQYL